MFSTSFSPSDEILIKGIFKGVYGELVRIKINDLEFLFDPKVIASVSSSKPVDPARENYNLIALAIEQGAQIEFNYRKNGTSDVELRCINPTDLLKTAAGKQLVAGDDCKTFRLDRIVGQIDVSS